ncbi:MAG: RHS repeat-associated core domain-containing protein, partial [Planctomycetota bacterium]
MQESRARRRAGCRVAVLILAGLMMAGCHRRRFSPPPLQTGPKSSSLAAALAELSEFLIDHELSATTGGAPLSEVLGCAPDPAGESILLSTGLASAGGVGHTDFMGDGRPDAIRFRIGLRVPEGARSLAFTSRFITTEHGSSGQIRKNDTATAEAELGGRVDVIGLGQSVTSYAARSPRRIHVVNVEGQSRVDITWKVTDAGDGLADSAIRISDAHFSTRQAPPGPLPPEDQFNRGDEVDPDRCFSKIDLATGSYTCFKQLIFVPAVRLPFSFSIGYCSSVADRGPLGRGWTHSYDWFVQRVPGELRVGRGDGRADYFEPQAGGWVPRYKGVGSSVIEHADKSVRYVTPSGVFYEFSAAGRLDSIQDPSGNRVLLSYDPAGRLVSIRDTRDQVTALAYGQNGLLSSVEYGGVLKASFSQDDEDNLVDFVEPTGAKTTFSYDESGRILTGTDAGGIVFVDNIYAGDRVIRQKDGAGTELTLDYEGDAVTVTDRLERTEIRRFDFAGNLTDWTVPAGHSWAYEYDQGNHLLKETDPPGNATRKTWDDAGNLSSYGDTLGKVIRMTHDGQGKLLSITDAAGKINRFTYDGAGRVVSETDPLGNAARYAYDASGRVSKFKDFRGNATTYAYSPAGDLLTITDASSGVVRKAYDPFGRLISRTDKRGNTTEFGYDLAGRLISRKDPLGGVTQWTRDGAGRILTRVLPDNSVTLYGYSKTGQILSVKGPGGESRFSYDKAGRLIARTDPLGRRTSHGYDQGDRLTSTTDPAGGRTLATYDAGGKRLTLTDPGGHTTKFAHDAAGRLTQEIDPLGRKTTRGYDDRDLVQSMTNRRGQTIRYHYDAAGRRTRLVSPSYDITHVLDANGNILKSGSGATQQILRTFDELDRLESRTDRFGNTIRYGYDAAGNLTEITYSDGKRVRYEYDALDRLVKVTDWAKRVTSYTYDVVGNLIRTERPDGSEATYSYDASGRLMGIEDNAFDGATILHTQDTLNAAGRVVSQDARVPLVPLLGAADIEFVYDAANQLNDNANSFSHDADGNLIRGSFARRAPVTGEKGRLRSKFVYDPLDRLISVEHEGGARASYSYDAAGNMTRALVVTGTETDPGGGPPVLLAYDELNRLMSVGGDSHVYDAEGLRIQSRIDGNTVRYVMDTVSAQPRLLEEHDQNGKIIARYVHGVGVISREAGNELSVYHFDRRGSTVALTNAKGRVTDRYAYGPYGAVVGRTGRTRNPFTYCGQGGVIDDGNGLYFMLGRYYAPSLRRFIQRGARSAGTMMRTQSLNRYAFAAGNPIGGIDPKGACPWCIRAGAISANVAVQIATDLMTACCKSCKLPRLETHADAVVEGGATPT